MSAEDAVIANLEHLIERDPNSGCWLWNGAVNGDGYGWVNKRDGAVGRHGRAHRFMYELYNGPIPAGLFVCHTCDTPPCVNPAHLWAGTSSDNARDRENKGRGKRPPNFQARTKFKKGDPPERWTRRITLEQRKELYDDPRPAHVLAAIYGINAGSINYNRRQERKTRPQQSDAIDLWVDGLTVEEISKRIGIKTGSVRHAVGRARRAGDLRAVYRYPDRRPAK